MGKIYPINKKFYMNNIRASVTNSMSGAFLLTTPNLPKYISPAETYVSAAKIWRQLGLQK